MAWQALDSDTYAADASGAGWVPVQLRANVAAVAEGRHPASSWGRTDPEQDAPASVAVSTPSDTWMAIPTWVAVDESATQVSLRLRYTCASASVSLRLWVDGAVSAATTVTTTATVTGVTMSATIEPGPARIVPAEIHVRSARGAEVDASISVDGIDGDGSIAHCSDVTSAAGLTHYEMEVTSPPVGSTVTGRRVYHVGRIVTHGSHPDLYIWPAWSSAWPDGGSATATLYDVGTLTVWGWSVWCEGDTVSGLPQSIGRPGVQTSASLWSSGHTWLAQVYRRGLVWTCGPPTQGGSLRFGALVDADAVAAGVLAERRTDAAGVRVGVALLPLDPAADVVVTVRVYGSDGTQEATATAALPVADMRSGPQGDDDRVSTAAWLVWAREGGGIVGTRDTARVTESAQPDSARGWLEQWIEVDWPAGVSVGELARVTVECDADAHWRIVCIAEVVDV